MKNINKNLANAFYKTKKYLKTIEPHEIKVRKESENMSKNPKWAPLLKCRPPQRPHLILSEIFAFGTIF